MLRCRTRSAIVPTLSRCFSAKGIKSGRRAIVPSALRISQITPVGCSPANSARSHVASVWPARTSTPPGFEISGKTWPGCTTSSGRALRAVATRTVCARSAAEMPVVTPLAASMETVNAVLCCARLSATISGKFNCRACASVSGMQIRPRPCVAIKLIASGVTKSAAMMRSPSFSRSSSSTRTTILPRRISSIISCVVAIVMVFTLRRYLVLLSVS